MKATIRLGKWFGVPVGLHYSWFIIAWLITLSLVSQFSAQNAGWTAATIWGLSIATAGLFFVCIVLHELSHATVARMSGMPVRGITLFALGGIAAIEKEAASPSKEFWMAIAGPIASLVIGFGCRGLAMAAGWTPQGPAPSPLAALLGWLGYINIALALFNLIPGFPLDGGRVLRSIVWAVTRNADRATAVAARIGQGVGVLFIASGLFSLLMRNNPGGLWIAFIGWFLLGAARATYAQTQLAAMLRGLSVADIMARDCAIIDADKTLRHFVDDELLRFSARCFAVSRKGQVLGLITPDDVRQVARDRWEQTTVSDAMRPLESMHPLQPDVPAAEALNVMGRENLNQLPVVAQGHLEGVVTRSYLAHVLQLRSELQTSG